MQEEIFVVSLGGSLIVPEDIDTEFLKDFRELVLSQVEKGKKFVIIAGGGKLNRKYNDAAKIISNPSNEDLDWLGIASLRLNAELLRVIFGDFAYGEVVTNLTKPFPFEKPVVIGSAFGPGRSSDWNAVQAAKTVGAKKVVNLSNIDYVYDSDPKVNPSAKKFERISWQDYRALTPKEWNPRLSSPFDPVASKGAEEESMEVVIMNGKPIENFKNYLEGEKFLGTIIS